MINRYSGTDIVESYDEFRHSTTFKKLPRTEAKVIERMGKLMQTMQQQGQHMDLEVAYRLLEMMAAPEDDGLLLCFLFTAYRAAAAGRTEDLRLAMRWIG